MNLPSLNYDQDARVADFQLNVSQPLSRQPYTTYKRRSSKAPSKEGVKVIIGTPCLFKDIKEGEAFSFLDDLRTCQGGAPEWAASAPVRIEQPVFPYVRKKRWAVKTGYTKAMLLISKKFKDDKIVVRITSEEE